MPAIIRHSDINRTVGLVTARTCVPSGSANVDVRTCLSLPEDGDSWVGRQSSTANTASCAAKPHAHTTGPRAHVLQGIEIAVRQNTAGVEGVVNQLAPARADDAEDGRTVVGFGGRAVVDRETAGVCPQNAYRDRRYGLHRVEPACDGRSDDGHIVRAGVDKGRVVCAQEVPILFGHSLVLEGPLHGLDE